MVEVVLLFGGRPKAVVVPRKVPCEVRGAGSQRGLHRHWRTRPVQREGGVDRRPEDSGDYFVGPETGLPPPHRLRVTVSPWQVVDPKAEADLVHLGKSVKQLAEVVEGIKRAVLVGNDIRISLDIAFLRP